MARKQRSIVATLFVTYFSVFNHVAEVQSVSLPVAANNMEETIANVSTDVHYSSTDRERHWYNKSTTLTNDNCKLKISNASISEFTGNVLKNRYNFVYLKLNFVNISLNATGNVIAMNDWVWTHKGEDGAHQYLYIPEDFGYLSFGLLWVHTMKQKLSVDIEKTGNCSRLTIGKKETDSLIGDALGKMTTEIASRHEEYNSSYWCYNKRVWIRSRFLYELCRNSVCTFQTVSYECCKFHFHYSSSKHRTIECHTEYYYYGAMWWVLPIITGNICFAFYPLILTKIGMKVKKMSKTMKKERKLSSNADDSDGRDFINKSNYLSLKSPNTITVFSTLFLPFNGLVLYSSRVLRIWIIIFPMCLSAIHVSLDYVYAKEFMVSAVQKGALVGFSAIVAGADEARKNCMYVFGGPIVASSICFSFWCLLIMIPSKLEDFVTIGIAGRVNKFIFLIRMPLKLKEQISGINVRRHKGCKKLHRLFLAQIFMLIHSKFWRHSAKLFCLRWKNMIFFRMYNVSQNRFAIVILCVFILPLYITFCVSELLLAILYYLFPVINCFLLVLNSVRIHYNDCFNQRGRISKFVLKCFQYILFMPMLVLFLISWYTYCITFFDGFWFLSRIAMFTYSGIVAYPNLSYGYLVLVFMTLFYLTESINAFGDRYKDLLKVSLECCEKFQQKHVNDVKMHQEDIKSIKTKYGIKIDLFYVIIKRNLPRSHQLLITVLKLISVITLLIVSVELLATFDKFKELSLVMHVFSVLFVCALPKIINMMCWKNLRDRTRNKMKQKVFRTITDYVRNKKRHVRKSTSNDYNCVFVSKSSGYESLTNDSDNEETDNELQIIMNEM